MCFREKPEESQSGINVEELMYRHGSRNHLHDIAVRCSHCSGDRGPTFRSSVHGSSGFHGSHIRPVAYFRSVPPDQGSAVRRLSAEAVNRGRISHLVQSILAKPLRDYIVGLAGHNVGDRAAGHSPESAEPDGRSVEHGRFPGNEDGRNAFD
jgi:hypothetical protein